MKNIMKQEHKLIIPVTNIVPQIFTDRLVNIDDITKGVANMPEIGRGDTCENMESLVEQYIMNERNRDYFKERGDNMGGVIF